MSLYDSEMQRFAEVLPTPVSLLGLDGCYRFANRAYANWYGSSQELLIGQHYLDVAGATVDEDVSRHLHSALAGSEARYEESAGEQEEGKHLARVTLLPDVDRHQRLRGLCVMLDVATLMSSSFRADHCESGRIVNAAHTTDRRLHELSRQWINVRETECKRIAAELHDGIGQNLSVIKFNIENYLRLLSEKGEDASVLEKVVVKVRETMEEVRRTAMDLRPAMLDDLGLLKTIQWFRREFESTFESIEFTLRVSMEENDVPNALKLNIYRILQETLNNVARHANARDVLVELDKDDSGIRLTIADNGEGFMIERAPGGEFSSPGFGLQSIRHRAAMTGADFTIESTSGEGTRIGLYWPQKALSSMID